jgi:hypothetical protein
VTCAHNKYTYYSGDKIKNNEMGGQEHVCEEMREVCRVLVERSLKRVSLRWEDNIKMDFQEVVGEAWAR